MKTCKGCQLTLPLERFYSHKMMKDGHLNWCKSCYVKRHAAGKALRQRKLLDYIQAIKLERGCADCGYNEHPAALDFDHLPGQKKLAKLSSAAAGMSKVRLDAEIAKCEVVCANCHRVRTAQRRS